MLKVLDVIFICCVVFIFSYFFLKIEKIPVVGSIDVLPIQENIAKESFIFKDYFFEKRAKFEIVGKVLSKQRIWLESRIFSSFGSTS